MSNERAEFSKRLAAAMLAAGHEPRPSVLFKQFNTRYDGPSVSFQTASRWLKGEAMPAQDKLVTLAEWLKEGPDFLRFGDKAMGEKHGARQVVREDASDYDDQKLFNAYRVLSAPHKQIVREVILAFAATTTRRSGGSKPRLGGKAQNHRQK